MKEIIIIWFFNVILSSLLSVLSTNLSPHNLLSNKPQSLRFPFLFTSHFSHPSKIGDPTAPKHLPRTRTKPPAQRQSLTPVLCPVTHMYCNHRQKQQKTLATHTTRSHPAVPTWQFALVVTKQKVALLSKGSTFLLRLFLGRCFFVIQFSENCP